MFVRTGAFAVLVTALCIAAFAAPAGAVPSTDLFDGAGVFLDNPQDVPDPQTLGTWLQQAHFTWVALHVDDEPTLESITPQWLTELRAHGLKVGVWGVEGYNVESDVALADLAVRTFGFDFYIADAENPFMNKGEWRSAQFVQAFRELQPTLPAALVTLGDAKAPFVLPMNFAAWRAGGFDLLPEAYYNQYKGDLPALTVAHAARAGWALDVVHPVIGVYHHYPAAKYVPLLQDLGTEGFSVFLADQMTPADYVALSGLAEAAATAAPAG
jgi:hypothetical protein